MHADADLEPILRAVEPAARLVSERRLRKVLYYLRDHGHPVPSNPSLPTWVARDDIVASEALTDETLAGTEPRLLLLTPPDDRSLEGRPAAEQLREYWRLLFQAGVTAAIHRKLGAGTLTAGTCAERLTRLGPAADREIRYVLETDHLADPAADPSAVYAVFAATYLDLTSFAPSAVDEFFPSLPAPDAVRAVLAEDVDVPTVLAKSRPDGAAAPDHEPPPDEFWADSERDHADAALSPAGGSPVAQLLDRARVAEGKGNVVRAAILRTQAARAGGDDRERALASAQDALAKLVQGLAGVLGWDDETAGEWQQALVPLLGQAAGGSWPRAARCLYELQKIPADLGREQFAIDLVEHLRTFGRRPVKRPLPHARGVMLLVRLRAAEAQLLRSGLPERTQFRLDRLFYHEIHRLEHHIRHTLTPVLTIALADSGFTPANRVEEVARDKVVAELLDRVCERGFLRIGDVRDAVARNQLKMADLSGPVEFLGGDPLLRADTRLTYDLDGVYRRGEFYLRWLQRGSSVFFGTAPGRLLTLYVIAPFLAAFLTLMMLEELRHLGGKVAAFAAKTLAPKPQPVEPPADTDPDGGWALDDEGWVTFDPEEASALAREVATASPPAEHHGSFLIEWPAIIGLGVFLLFMFHVPPFRRAVFTVVTAAWRLVRRGLWDVPKAVLHSAAVRSVRYSGPVRFFHRRLAAAVLFTAAFVLLLWLLGASPARMLRWGGVVFGLAVLLFNTPWGWHVQDRVSEWLTDWWRVVRVNLIPGLIAAVLEAFRRLANWVERQLYAVDEWLRYRGGDSQGSLALKAVLGLLWFPVAYVARFAFNLLIEPQINPVKHFPVVTVSHKVILPMTPSLAGAINVSDATAAGLLGCIPGVFGFIAWELMSNWQLYRANRPDRLRPVTIGSHGESMRGLLRPGFHSGTVPRLFRKMRAARRKGQHAAEARLHHELDHAAEAVHRFAERELVGLLERTPEWGGTKAEIAAVRFGCQRVRVEVSAPGGGSVFAVAFENRGGRIGATVEAGGWLDRMAPARRAAFVAAVRGLLDMAAAELFEEWERRPEPAKGHGSFRDLTRPYSWAEWVARWEPAAGRGDQRASRKAAKPRRRK